MKHKLAVTVENNPGVLSRVSGLFSRRGYNIDSLVVSDTEDPTVSRMTIVVHGDEVTIEQKRSRRTLMSMRLALVLLTLAALALLGWILWMVYDLVV